MLVLTVTFLAVGALLAALGTLGFCVVASTAPDADDLGLARLTATAGRRMIYAGVIGLAAAHVAFAGPMLATVAMLGFTAAISLVTRAPLRAQARSAPL